MGRPHGLGPASGSRLLLTRTTALPTSRRPGTPGVLMTGRGGAGARAEGVRVFTPARLGAGSRAPRPAVLLQGLGGSEVSRLGPRARALGSAHGQNRSSLCVTHPLLLGHQPRVPIPEEEWSPYPGVMHRNSGTPGG